MPNRLKQISVEGERFYFSLSFDIGKYDGGLWWLQIYDNNYNLIYDKPFASSMFAFNEKVIKKEVKKVVKDHIFSQKGLIL